MSKKTYKLHRLQVYLPEDIYNNLQKYIGTKFLPGSRVVSSMVRKALAEFLEKEGYSCQVPKSGEQNSETA